MLDLTSSYYSLVVLCSATLGLSTYVHNHYVAMFKDHQGRCKSGWQKRSETNKTFTFSEDTKKKIDSIENQKPITIFGPIAFLASALPYAAVGQALNLVKNYWGDNHGLTTSLVLTLLVWFFITLVSTLFIIYRLNKIRKDTENLKDNVDSVLTVADAEFTGYSNNNKPNGSPPPTPTPRIRNP
jgi:hypothetical protein